MIFEKGTQQKVRFFAGRGSSTMEDLFDLPLEGNCSLDKLAQSLHKELKDSGSKSFVKKRSVKDATVKLKLDIVKRVIDIRLDEISDQKTKLDNKHHNEKILSAIADVENKELQGKTPKELRKMLK